MKPKIMYLFSTQWSPRGYARIALNSGSATARAKTRNALNKYKIISLLKENKLLVYYVAFFFLIMAVFGYLQPNYFEDIQTAALNEILANIDGKDVFGVSLFIIINNLKTALLSILLGIIFLPILAVIINGYFVGAILHKAIENASPLIMWRLLPHGVFELPAIFISFAFGIKIGLALFKKHRKKELLKAYKEAFFMFVYVIVPLLVLAGIIEGVLFFAVNG